MQHGVREIQTPQFAKKNLMIHSVKRLGEIEKDRYSDHTLVSSLTQVIKHSQKT